MHLQMGAGSGQGPLESSANMYPNINHTMRRPDDSPGEAKFAIVHLLRHAPWQNFLKQPGNLGAWTGPSLLVHLGRLKWSSLALHL